MVDKILPVCRAATQPARTTMPTRRILLVDDEDDVRLSLRLLLEVSGHEVEEADDGLDGVQKALSWEPDVVLVDLDMPVLNGFGLARRLREARGATIRLIALTGRD